MVQVGDAALTRVTTIDPLPDIKANGENEPVNLVLGENLDISIMLDPGSYSGVQADWWCIATSPFGRYYRDSSNQWREGFHVSYQGPTFEITTPFEVSNMGYLRFGSHTFYFGINRDRNGTLDEPLNYGSVHVNIITPYE